MKRMMNNPALWPYVTVLGLGMCLFLAYLGTALGWF